jgi:hypothetical protein
MEVSGQLHAPATLSPGKEPPDIRMGGIQSCYGCSGEEKRNMFKYLSLYHEAIRDYKLIINVTNDPLMCMISPSRFHYVKFVRCKCKVFAL